MAVNRDRARMLGDADLLHIAQTSKFVSISQIIERFPISRTAITRLVEQGKLLEVRFGCKRLIESASLDAYLASQILANHADTPDRTPPTQRRAATQQRIYERLTQAA